MNKKPSSDGEGQKPPVVEGEILRENNSARDRGAGARQPVQSGAWRRTPWYLALALAVFVGGLFAGPWVEGTLRQLFPGLMPPQVDLSEQIRQITVRQDGLATRMEQFSSQDAEIGIDQVALNERLAPIMARMRDIDARLQRLESAEATHPSDPTGALGDDALAQIAQLSSRLDQLESAQAVEVAAASVAATSTESGQGEGRINQLEVRLGLMENVIAAMQKQDPAQADSSTLLPVAFVALARDMELALPYDNRLRDIRAILMDQPALLRASLEPDLALLERSSTTGLLALDDLRDRFSPIIAEILKSDAINAETTWWGRAWADVKGLIVVRPIGDAEGADLAATLARAEFALARGDVATAVSIIAALEGLDTNALDEWSGYARAYVEAQAALDHAMSVLLDRQRGH